MSRTVLADLKPVQGWVDALVAQRREDFTKDNMSILCLPLGPRYITAQAADVNIAGMIKVVQTPALILMLNPDLTYRQIFLDGRALEKDPNPSWMGYSVGRWQGDLSGMVGKQGGNADHAGTFLAGKRFDVTITPGRTERFTP